MAAAVVTYTKKTIILFQKLFNMIAAWIYGVAEFTNTFPKTKKKINFTRPVVPVPIPGRYGRLETRRIICTHRKTVYILFHFILFFLVQNK